MPESWRGKARRTRRSLSLAVGEIVNKWQIICPVVALVLAGMVFAVVSGRNHHRYYEMNDEDSQEPYEDAWVAEQRGVVLAYIQREGVQHREVGEWPAWHVLPYLAITPTANKPSAGSAGIASRLTIDDCRPGVPEPGRSVKMGICIAPAFSLDSS